MIVQFLHRLLEALNKRTAEAAGAGESDTSLISKATQVPPGLLQCLISPVAGKKFWNFPEDSGRGS